MRRVAVFVLLALAAQACDGRERVVSPETPTVTSPPSPSVAPSATGSQPPSPSPAPGLRPIPPAWAAPIETDLEPAELPDEALVPPGADLTGRIDLPAGGGVPHQVAVSYGRGDDPFIRERGFAIWQRFPDAPAWSVVYAFVDPARKGVLGIRMQSGDLTGDGHEEVLVFEETGGTGACGTWRVVAATQEDTEDVFRRRTCDAELTISGEVLGLREALYEPDDPHCCPSAIRLAVYEWDGSTFVETSNRVEQVRS